MPPRLSRSAEHGIALRPMTDDDLPFVAALYASTRAEEVAHTGWPDERQRAFLAQQHEAQHRHYRAAHPNAEWLIVEQAGEAIGRLYLVELEDRLHVIDISLVRAARGQGIGAAIITDVLAAAEAAGKRVSIHVEQGNPARRLYERLGFRPLADKGASLQMEWRPANSSVDGLK